MKTKTSYGWKKEGESKFVIVAPHGAGDDELTDIVAEEIAKIMDATVVVNTRYRRESCDLNDISDLADDEKKREFFKDVGDYAKEVRGHSAKEHDGKEHAIVVYIHGMKGRGDKGIDIGIGAKWNKRKKKYQGAKYHPDSGKKKGKVRANIGMTREMRVKMDKKLKAEKGKRAWMGKVYAAWDEKNGIQYHAGTGDYSMQIEISSRSIRRRLQKIVMGVKQKWT